MILFGYKKSSGSLVRAIACIVTGGILLFNPEEAPALLVRAIGAIIFASGLISLTISILGQKKKKSKTFGFGEANHCMIILLGLFFLLFPHVLTSVIFFFLGLGLVIFAMMQMFVIGSALSLMGLGFSSLIFSSLALVGGLLILFNPFTGHVISIVAGALLVYYGITELLWTRKVSSARKEYEIHYGAQEGNTRPSVEGVNHDNDLVKDVDFEKVDEQQ